VGSQINAKHITGVIQPSYAVDAHLTSPYYVTAAFISLAFLKVFPDIWLLPEGQTRNSVGQ
jgi:hypothetical protein